MRKRPKHISEGEHYRMSHGDYNPDRTTRKYTSGWGTQMYEGEDKYTWDNRRYIKGRLGTHKGQLMKWSGALAKAKQEGTAKSRLSVIDRFKESGDDTATGIGLLAGYARDATWRHGEGQARQNLIGSMGKDYDEGYYDLVKAYSQDETGVVKKARRRA